jgi:hypothetical protein
MVRKNKFVFETPRYYLHYDKKTGVIVSISNQLWIIGNPPAFEITEEDHRQFRAGEKKAHEYIIGYAKGISGKTELSLIPVTTQLYGFRHNIFEWIKTPPDDTTECIVTWDSTKQSWIFALSKKAKARLSDGIMRSTIFFVMLQDDFDFLIRSIIIDVKELVKDDEIQIPFSSNIETKINKISISSKIYFQSYGLIIND